MGGHVEFRCESCGYEAMVSGREDFGFKVYTATILCEGCEKERPFNDGAGRG